MNSVPSSTTTFGRFLNWTLLFMFSPIIVGFCLALVGGILGSRSIIEMAGIMWLTFVTVPSGVAAIVLFGLVRLHKNRSNRPY